VRLDIRSDFPAINYGKQLKKNIQFLEHLHIWNAVQISMAGMSSAAGEQFNMAKIYTSSNFILDQPGGAWSELRPSSRM